MTHGPMPLYTGSPCQLSLLAKVDSASFRVRVCCLPHGTSLPGGDTRELEVTAMCVSMCGSMCGCSHEAGVQVLSRKFVCHREMRVQLHWLLRNLLVLNLCNIFSSLA
ncbi:uncharacterized protein LOC119180972 [Rhipicephalus microplus]|uniref:uncharacterized protein LOC119180972 n=1 Tax=Rhipicephalus microplus TaxID=6941 RepID=UPI003F6C7350